MYLVSTPHLSTVSLSFDRTPPVPNQFFELVAGELFRLSSVPFSISSLNFFSTCERNSLTRLMKVANKQNTEGARSRFRVKEESCNRSGVAQRVPGGLGSQIS